MNIAVIPARGGSKRIPRKNIKLFAGKPIIAYSIRAALECGLFDTVLVSTDDEEIASLAVYYGASVPFLRPKNLADDFTGTSAVVKHAIHWMHNSGRHFSFTCCIYATAPFIRAEYLHDAYLKLRNSSMSFAFSVASFPFPIQRAVRITSAGAVEPLYPQFIESRSQDLEETYHDAGQFYWGATQAFLNDAKILSSSSIPIVLPRYLVQDIDTCEDWTMAELMYKSLQSSQQEVFR